MSSSSYRLVRVVGVARPLICDTTLLIAVLGEPAAVPGFVRSFLGRQVYLPAVALAEVYAGTRGPRDGRLVDQIAHAFALVDRVLTPTADEWARAGRLINRAIRLRGAMQPRDHLADVLIVHLAARLRGAVVTANVVDFDGWVSLGRLDVAVLPHRSAGGPGLP